MLIIQLKNSKKSPEHTHLEPEAYLTATPATLATPENWRKRVKTLKF